MNAEHTIPHGGPGAEEPDDRSRTQSGSGSSGSTRPIPARLLAPAPRGQVIHRDLHDLRLGIGERAMARDPANRYDDVGALARVRLRGGRAVRVRRRRSHTGRPALEENVKKLEFQGHPGVVRSFRSAREVDKVHVLFVAESEASGSKPRDLLRQVGDRPVMIAGESLRFANRRSHRGLNRMIDPAAQEALRERVQRIPITSTLRMEFLDWGPGTCKVRVPYQKQFDGVYESFHGGLLMTVADSVACFAILTQTGPDQVLTTTDMNIRFLAPCLTDVTAEARVIKLGRTLCPVAVDLHDAGGRHVAVAQVTYIRLPAMPDRPRPAPTVPE